jgi:hypothetical protein
MKRFFVSILAVLYLASASGATVHLHYCMGHLIGTTLGSGDEHNCNKCGMTKKSGKGCCKDEYKIVKTDQSHQTAKIVFQPIQHILSAPVISFPETRATALYHAENKMALGHAPPFKWRGCAIYIQVRDFRI